MINMKLVQNWIPFAFCTALVYQYVLKGSSSPENWQYFSIWLPMCFFYVGGVMHLMQKQIQGLKTEIKQLQKPKQD